MIFYTRAHLGFHLASALCSAPTLWRQRAGPARPLSAFLIPSDVGKPFKFSALFFDIPQLPREDGQPCRANVKHMWSADMLRIEWSKRLRKVQCGSCLARVGGGVGFGQSESRGA